MRILFLNRFFYPDHSATSQLLSDLAFHLARRGHRVEVVTSRLRYDDPAARLPPLEEIAGVRVRRVWTSRFGRAFLPGRAIDYLTFYLSVFFALLRNLEPGDLVVAKTDPPLLSVVAALACRLRGGRLVNWVQDLFPEVATALGVRGMAGGFGRFLQRQRNGSLKTAVGNVVLGERMRQRLLDEGVRLERLHVVHNWADGEAIRPWPEGAPNPLRGEWRLGDRFVVGYSGNLGRAHEIDTLLAAAERLRAEPDLVFLFIGGGALLGRLRDEVERRGLAGLFRFVPYQPRERLGESLAVADIHLVILRPEMEGLIVPSKFYGILAAGRPALFVGDPEGEVARLLAAGGSGWTVAAGDGEGLARRILELRGDRQALAAAGRRARGQFEAQFQSGLALASWETLLVQWKVNSSRKGTQATQRSVEGRGGVIAASINVPARASAANPRRSRLVQSKRDSRRDAEAQRKSAEGVCFNILVFSAPLRLCARLSLVCSSWRPLHPFALFA